MSSSPYLDTMGLWDSAVALPELLPVLFDTASGALADGGWPADGPEVHAVAVCGLGADEVAARAVAALGDRTLPVPLWVSHGATLPAFVDRHTVVCALSGTGADEETLTAAEDALARGARLIAAGGGADDALAGLAAASGSPWCPSPPGGARSVGALASAVAMPLVALAGAGLLPDPAPSFAAAAASLTARRDRFVAGGLGAELARRIGRTIPLVYGAEGVGATAARWWKVRLNTNAKAPAFNGSVPAVAYDEIAGWGQDGDVTRQVVTLLFLRHAGEPSGAAEAFDAVFAATEEVMADVLEVRAEGGDDLECFFDLALLGELVSLHIAGSEGVDPGPIPAVEGLHRD